MGGAGFPIFCGCLATLLLPLAQAYPADPVQSGPGHRFACADYSQDKVFVVAADGRVEWEHAAPGCDDVTVLPNGHLLCTTRTGVLEVTPAKEIVFQYTVRQRDIRLPKVAQRPHIRWRVYHRTAVGSRYGRQDRPRNSPVTGRHSRRSLVHAQCSPTS